MSGRRSLHAARAARQARRPLAAVARLTMVLALGMLLGLHPPAVRAAPAPTPVTPTVMRVAQMASSVVVGTKVPITLRITTPDGSPVADARVLLYLDGVLLRGDRSDQTGTVALEIRGTELSRAHLASVRFAFAGDRTHGASSLTRTLEVAAATLRVITVPAVPGLPLTLGTTSARTGPDGVATIPVPQVGSYLLTPSLDLGPTSGERLSFIRWQDGVFDPARNVHVTGDQTLVLGLRVAVRASMTFVDQDGAPVPASDIDSVTISSSDGQSITLRSFEDLWWVSATSSSRPDGLTPVSTVYRVNEVLIAGANTINRGQLTWTPAEGQPLVVPVLLYQLRITTADALFGWPLQGPLELVYPDGSITRTAVGPSGELSFSALPRGAYTIRFHIGGMSPPTPVALSRPQTAVLRTVTYLDMAVVAAILAGIAVLLLVLGRRHQLAGAYRRVATAPGTVRAAEAAGQAEGLLALLSRRLDARLGLGAGAAGPAGPSARGPSEAQGAWPDLGTRLDRLDQLWARGLARLRGSATWTRLAGDVAARSGPGKWGSLVIAALVVGGVVLALVLASHLTGGVLP